MAQLIHLRQRIKTVETIKKITHAMRLISMSTHAQLSKQFHAIKKYHAALSTLFARMPNSQDALFGTKKPSQRKLLIVIGAQKGLCGSFNSGLFHYLLNVIKKEDHSLHIIPIGKKTVDFIQEHYTTYCSTTFTHLTPETVSAIAQTIAQLIFQNNSDYLEVSILSNTVKSFFVQVPHMTTMIPMATKTTDNVHTTEDYVWDTNPHDIIEQITQQYITSSLHSLLLESLLAEHAARFVSMDSSTRNAEKILETTRLKYNKLRQAKITKEILELADAF
jgi:F-type H+-transporting ATPase subunit gamma